MPGLTPSQQVLDSPQYGALKDYLAAGDAKLNSTLDAFCKPIEDKLASNSSSSDVEETLRIGWQAIVGLAASTPYSSPDQETLAKFLVLLAYRSNLVEDGKPYEIDGMLVWRDLPVLGWELREAWNAAASDNSEQQAKNQWVNINAFTSTLVASLHSSAVDRPDYSLFCIWTIRTALEDQNEPSDVAVAAAAVWLMCAAPALWDYSHQSKSFDGKVARPGPLFKDQDWIGFSEARWSSWRQRLHDVKPKVSSEATGALVQQAIDAMSLHS